MRQAGYLAAAGIYALDNHIDRLKEDHRRAKILGDIVKSLSFIEDLMPVDTNIVIAKLAPEMPVNKFLSELESKEILAVQFGKQEVRFVTHLDLTDDMLDRTMNILKKMND